MYNKSILKHYTNDVMLTNFEQGITDYSCETITGDELYLSEDTLCKICENNNTTIDKLLPDYESLINEFKTSNSKNLDEWISNNYPGVTLEEYERHDFME